MNAIPSAAGQLRALVVDDQEPMREIIRHLLRDIGIRHVATAESGRKALELLLDRTREFPDIILCDLHMDDMSGTELIHKMRRAKTIRNRDVPVIVVTGEEDKLLLDVAAQVGANAVMQKPLAVRDLAKKIAAIVGYEVSPA